ncbi:MAG: hypothetical protein ACTSU5_17375 [Promethearchaeota archaeon]
MNFVLFVVFLVVWGVFNLLRFDLIYGIDPWEHLRVSAGIAHGGSLDFSEYEGYLGLHVIGAEAMLLSGCDPFFVAYYFPLFSVVASGLVAFQLSHKFLRDVEFSALTVLLMYVVPYGFFSGQGQFWPTGLAVLLGLSALSQLVGAYESPDRFLPREAYFLLIQLVSMSLVHEVVSLFYLVLFTLVWLSFFLRGVRDIHLTVAVLGSVAFHFLYSSFFPSALSWKIFGVVLGYPWYLLVAVGVGLAFVGFFVVKAVWTRLGYEGTPFYDELAGGGLKREKTRNEKLIPFVLLVPVLLVPVMLFIVIPYLANWLFLSALNLVLPTLFMLEGLIITAIGIEKLYKTGPRGKILFLWAVLFGLVFLSFLIADAVLQAFPWWPRAMLLSAPILSIGVTGYMYRNSLRGAYREKKVARVLLVFYFAFATVGGLQYESNILVWTSKGEDESARWMAARLPDGVTLVGGIRWHYNLDYYSGKRFDTGQYRFSYYLFPENQTLENGTFGPRNLAHARNSSGMYLLLDDSDKIIGVFSIDAVSFGKMTDADFAAYAEIREFNRVYSGPKGVQLYQLVEL